MPSRLRNEEGAKLVARSKAQRGGYGKDDESTSESTYFTVDTTDTMRVAYARRAFKYGVASLFQAVGQSKAVDDDNDDVSETSLIPTHVINKTERDTEGGQSLDPFTINSAQKDICCGFTVTNPVATNMASLFPCWELSELFPSYDDESPEYVRKVNNDDFELYKNGRWDKTVHEGIVGNTLRDDEMRGKELGVTKATKLLSKADLVRPKVPPTAIPIAVKNPFVNDMRKLEKPNDMKRIRFSFRKRSRSKSNRNGKDGNATTDPVSAGQEVENTLDYPKLAKPIALGSLGRSTATTSRQRSMNVTEVVAAKHPQTTTGDRSKRSSSTAIAIPAESLPAMATKRLSKPNVLRRVKRSFRKKESQTSVDDASFGRPYSPAARISMRERKPPSSSTSGQCVVPTVKEDSSLSKPNALKRVKHSFRRSSLEQPNDASPNPVEKSTSVAPARTERQPRASIAQSIDKPSSSDKEGLRRVELSLRQGLPAGQSREDSASVDHPSPTGTPIIQVKDQSLLPPPSLVEEVCFTSKEEPSKPNTLKRVKCSFRRDGSPAGDIGSTNQSTTASGIPKEPSTIDVEKLEKPKALRKVQFSFRKSFPKTSGDNMQPSISVATTEAKIPSPTPITTTIDSVEHEERLSKSSTLRIDKCSYRKSRSEKSNDRMSVDKSSTAAPIQVQELHGAATDSGTVADSSTTCKERISRPDDLKSSLELSTDSALVDQPSPPVPIQIDQHPSTTTSGSLESTSKSNSLPKAKRLSRRDVSSKSNDIGRSTRLDVTAKEIVLEQEVVEQSAEVTNDAMELPKSHGLPTEINSRESNISSSCKADVSTNHTNLNELAASPEISATQDQRISIPNMLDRIHRSFGNDEVPTTSQNLLKDSSIEKEVGIGASQAKMSKSPLSSVAMASNDTCVKSSLAQEGFEVTDEQVKPQRLVCTPNTTRSQEDTDISVNQVKLGMALSSAFHRQKCCSSDTSTTTNTEQQERKLTADQVKSPISSIGDDEPSALDRLDDYRIDSNDIREDVSNVSAQRIEVTEDQVSLSSSLRSRISWVLGRRQESGSKASTDARDKTNNAKEEVEVPANGHATVSFRDSNSDTCDDMSLPEPFKVVTMDSDGHKGMIPLDNACGDETRSIVSFTAPVELAKSVGSVMSSIADRYQAFLDEEGSRDDSAVVSSVTHEEFEVTLDRVSWSKSFGSDVSSTDDAADRYRVLPINGCSPDSRDDDATTISSCTQEEHESYRYLAKPSILGGRFRRMLGSASSKQSPSTHHDRYHVCLARRDSRRLSRE